MPFILHAESVIELGMLVSIIVITYNSEKFVLETLESVKAQSYGNIELIITDDCSIDQTVNICTEWIDKNKKRFSRVELISCDKNQGIAANCNRGLISSKGDWIKLIAGDDILKPDCIKDCLDFISSGQENVECLFAKIEQFADDQTFKIVPAIVPDPDLHPFYCSDVTAKEQFSMWLNVNTFWPLSTPSFFIKKDLILSVGGFDERYEYMEDLPLYLRILEKNIKIYFLNKVTTMYRVHSESVIRKKSGGIIINKFRISRNLFIKNYIIPRVPWSLKIRLIHELLFDRLVLMTGNRGNLSNLIHNIGIKLNPVRLSWFNRKFNNIYGQKVNRLKSYS